MVDDPVTYPYASTPEPENVHVEVKIVLHIFFVTFVINLLSDTAKIFMKIDTGFK